MPRLRSLRRSSKSRPAATATRPWTFPTERRGKTASIAADTRRFFEMAQGSIAKTPRHFRVPLSTLPPLSSVSFRPRIRYRRIASSPRPPLLKKLAGEEGFEPPHPVLETGGLPLNLLPFTLSPAQRGEGFTLALFCPAQRGEGFTLQHPASEPNGVPCLPPLKPPVSPTLRALRTLRASRRSVPKVPDFSRYGMPVPISCRGSNP